MAQDRRSVIRPFQTEDIDALQRVRAAAFAPVFVGLRAALGVAISELALSSAEEEQASLLDRLCAGEDGARVLVAVAEGEPVGFVAFHVRPPSRVGEIGLNAVHPEYAGRGIGSRLYAAALSEMRAHGLMVAEVATGADEAHAPARRAYAKAGFAARIETVVMYREIG